MPALFVVLVAGAACSQSAPRFPPLQTGRLGEVRLIEPRGLVYLFSSPDGWGETDQQVAGSLAHQGAIVIGVDWAAYRRALDASEGQ